MRWQSGPARTCATGRDDGRVYSLGLDLSAEAPRTPGRNPLWHLASKTDVPGPVHSSADGGTGEA